LLNTKPRRVLAAALHTNANEVQDTCLHVDTKTHRNYTYLQLQRVIISYQSGQCVARQ